MKSPCSLGNYRHTTYYLKIHSRVELFYSNCKSKMKRELCAELCKQKQLIMNYKHHYDFSISPVCWGCPGAIKKCLHPRG